MPLTLQGATLPSDAEIPQTAQEILDLIEDNFTIDGADELTGVVVSETEPGADDQDKLWVKLDSDGDFAGFYYYNGEWKRVTIAPNSGPTANRPSDPQDYEQYFDTDINCLIHWERNAWRTVAGTPGDIKFVDTEDTDYATALANALTRNPGWSELTAARGRALIGAGTGSSLTARSPGETVGEEDTEITKADLEHTHTVGRRSANSGSNSDTGLFKVSSDSDDSETGAAIFINGEGGEDQSNTTLNAGTGDWLVSGGIKNNEFSDENADTLTKTNMQPSIAFVILKKD